MTWSHPTVKARVCLCFRCVSISFSFRTNDIVRRPYICHANCEWHKHHMKNKCDEEETRWSETVDADKIDEDFWRYTAPSSEFTSHNNGIGANGSNPFFVILHSFVSPISRRQHCQLWADVCECEWTLVIFSSKFLAVIQVSSMWLSCHTLRPKIFNPQCDGNARGRNIDSKYIFWNVG